MKHATWLLLLLFACDARDDGFRLVAVSPAADQVLRLNEPIVWEFDRPVDRTSVNTNSIRIHSSRPVPGAFRVRGSRVEFLPTPSDGTSSVGWPAGETVTIAVAGFPARDGLWSSDREALAESSSTRWTVTAAQDPAAAYVDVEPAQPLTLRGADGARTIAVREDGFVRLEFSEPLQPESVVESSFPLEFDDAARTRAPLELRFAQTATGATVDLRPRSGFAPRSARFVLELGALGVRDLRGVPCRASATWTLVATADAPALARIDAASGETP